MKLNFLEKFEERFYFKTSYLFWHLLTGIGTLALVVGVVIFLWSLAPSFKPGVNKPRYPKPVKVEVAEIMELILPTAQKTIDKPSESTQPVSNDKSAPRKAAEPGESEYLKTVDKLKALLPSDKFSWESKGHWQRDWYDRRWVVDVLGLQDKLESTYRKVNVDDYASKKQLLEAYIALVTLFPMEQRLSALKSTMEFSKEDVSTSVSNTKLLQAAVANFSTDNADFIETLATFGKKNPRDGRPFIEYANTTLPKFNPEVRRPILNTLVSSYSTYFNNIERQKEATNLFLDMLNHFAPDTQEKALDEYYKLYREKNYAREEQIKEIEEEYQAKLDQSESIVSATKSKKATYFALGGKIIGGSVILIAMVAILLVLLSIQRNIKQIREMTRPAQS